MRCGSEVAAARGDEGERMTGTDEMRERRRGKTDGALEQGREV
jgi:hypothetical protein